MPNAALHLLLASAVFERWAAATPGDAGSAAARNAFLHGAIGPDMGYFPGGDRRLSELAHTSSPVRLARALVAEAETVTEQAYAWGWVTHVLADVGIHPHVNEAVGELLFGVRGRRVPPAADPVSHLRVEAGLDAVCYGRHPALRRIRLSPSLAAGAGGFLVRAYRRTYGAAPPEEAFLASHRGVCHAAGPLLTLNRVASLALGGTPGDGWTQAVRALSGLPLQLLHTLSPRGSAACGLFDPLPPPGWLAERVDGYVRAFPRLFGRHHGAGLRELEEHDLDTGEAVPAPAASPVAEAPSRSRHAPLPLWRSAHAPTR